MIYTEVIAVCACIGNLGPTVRDDFAACYEMVKAFP